MGALFPTREPMSSQDVGRALNPPAVAWVPDVTGSGLSPCTPGTEEVAPADHLSSVGSLPWREGELQIYTIMFLHFSSSLF